MNPYRHADWIRFRKEIIKLHGNRCARCHRSKEHDGVVLQVHHPLYFNGRLPWEYAHTECEALCKGCHAEEHGKIMPQSGWDWLATDDLGDILDNCELCGQNIRYVYAISHSKWGSMAVGTDCCDKLTGTSAASEYHDKYIKTIDMRKRFVNSKKRRTLQNRDLRIVRKGIEVLIRAQEDNFIIIMDTAPGNSEYNSVLDAKIKVFDVINSGDAAAYLDRFRKKKARALREAREAQFLISSRHASYRDGYEVVARSAARHP